MLIYWQLFKMVKEYVIQLWVFYQVKIHLKEKVLKNKLKKNVKISLPIIMKNNDMNFYKWSSTEILILNKFGRLKIFI